ncbi:MAG: winged helix DNA-binding domain-containing protein [Chloroflexi bacterium]|nr:winged helix DNA-binding domain-containing protein [Chloroflexota bacterium]
MNRLELTRAQILGHRRAAGELNRRLPFGADALRRAAWAGLQDSMPRAAVLSIHARVEGTQPNAWEDPTLVQLWGPRFGAYVVAAQDRAVFSLGRLPADAKGLRRAQDMAALLHDYLDGRTMRYGDAGHGVGMHGNHFRYAAPTGTVLIRWDGSRQPTVWTVPPPDMDASAARLELARRYLHVLGPTTPGSFARWAGISARDAHDAFATLEPELTPARSPIGDGSVLLSDEASFRGPAEAPGNPRFLPSGDAYWLLHGSDRELLVPDRGQRDLLWTPRVWPGALLVAGEIAGTWRRADADLAIEPWRTISASERHAVEAEAASLPLGLATPIRVRWVTSVPLAGPLE